VYERGAEDDDAEFMVKDYSECGKRMQGFSEYGAEIYWWMHNDRCFAVSGERVETDRIRCGKAIIRDCHKLK
jgi:hypothetical protein